MRGRSHQDSCAHAERARDLEGRSAFRVSCRCFVLLKMLLLYVYFVRRWTGGSQGAKTRCILRRATRPRDHLLASLGLTHVAGCIVGEGEDGGTCRLDYLVPTIMAGLQVTPLARCMCVCRPINS